MKIDYDLIFSLGEACLCASLLKRVKVAYNSNPFDWVFGSSFLKRIDLLCNRFEKFLMIEDLKFVGSRQVPISCNIYANERNELVFNHDFPFGKELNESFESVKIKYDRRIKRLLDYLDGKNEILLVYICLPDSKDNLLSDVNICLATKKLCDAFKANMKTLFITHDCSIPDKEFVLNEIDDSTYKVRLFNKPHIVDDKNPMYIGNVTNCETLLQRFKTREKVNIKDEYLYKTL